MPLVPSIQWRPQAEQGTKGGSSSSLWNPIEGECVNDRFQEGPAFSAAPAVFDGHLIVIGTHRGPQVVLQRVRLLNQPNEGGEFGVVKGPIASIAKVIPAHFLSDFIGVVVIEREAHGGGAFLDEHTAQIPHLLERVVHVLLGERGQFPCTKESRTLVNGVAQFTGDFLLAAAQAKCNQEGNQKQKRKSHGVSWIEVKGIRLLG